MVKIKSRPQTMFTKNIGSENYSGKKISRLRAYRFDSGHSQNKLPLAQLDRATAFKIFKGALAKNELVVS